MDILHTLSSFILFSIMYIGASISGLMHQQPVTSVLMEPALATTSQVISTPTTTPAQTTATESVTTNTEIFSQNTPTIPTKSAARAGRETVYYENGAPTQYSEDGLNVYYTNRVIPNADPATFTIIASADGYSGYARDKNQVYWNGQTILDADPKTFAFIADVNNALHDTYAEDKNHLYENADIIPDADRATFVILRGYAKDKHSVYCAAHKISNADPSSFKIVSATYSSDEGMYKTRYAKDGVSVYSGCNKMTYIDPVSFEVLTSSDGAFSGYIKDAQHVYFHDATVPGADAPTFQIGGTDYDAHDRNNRYRYGQAVNSGTYLIDANGNETNFKVDGNKVMFAGTVPVTGANPATFKVLSDANGDGTDFAKDNSTVFFQNKPFTGADPASFTLLFYRDGSSSGYAKDALRVYYSFPRFNASWFQPGTIEGADPTTFTTSVLSLGVKGLAKDKKSVYMFGVPIQDSDPNSFKNIQGGTTNTRYFADASRIYYFTYDGQDRYQIVPVPGVDATTFTLLMDNVGQLTNYAKDAHTVLSGFSATSTIPIAIPGADSTSFRAISPVQSCNPNPSGNCFFDAADNTHHYFKGNPVQ